jgi:sarcosine oxidase subunit alpha
VDTARPGRKQFVALLPVDPAYRPPEGAHVLAGPDLTAPPVPYLGHVTSSYDSPALGRPFALALVAGGRDRIGTQVWTTVDGQVAPAVVAHPVLYNPQGARRDG